MIRNQPWTENLHMTLLSNLLHTNIFIHNNSLVSEQETNVSWLREDLI